MASTPTVFQLSVMELGQLEAGARISPDETKEKKRTIAMGKEEKIDTNASSITPKSKHEPNSGAIEPEPGSQFIVWWDEPADQDPENPMNWSSKRKWSNILSISVISFLV